MIYEKLYINFKNSIPNGIEFYEKMEADYAIDENVGMHIAFGTVIVPYILHIADKNYKHELSKVFDFIEKMAISEDDRIKNVLSVTILDMLSSVSEDKQKIFLKYMKKNTIKLWFCN